MLKLLFLKKSYVYSETAQFTVTSTVAVWALAAAGVAVTVITYAPAVVPGWEGLVGPVDFGEPPPHAARLPIAMRTASESRPRRWWRRTDGMKRNRTPASAAPPRARTDAALTAAEDAAVDPIVIVDVAAAAPPMVTTFGEIAQVIGLVAPAGAVVTVQE